MPVLTPAELGEMPVKLEKLTRKFEEKLLEDISRRIAKAGTITDTAEWQIIRMKEMGYANKFIEKSLAEYTKKSDEEIRQLFFDAGQCSDEFYSKVYAAANKDFIPLKDNPEMRQLAEAGILQTKKELKNFTQSMGFAVFQADGTTAFTPVAKAYQDALDLAQMQVSTGVFDYNTAIRNATRTLCDGGLRFVDYATGHVNHADVAVRRAVLTGVSQLTGKISEHNAAELETDIVEVTAHAGARPDHAEWQGRWYSLSGKSLKYPSLVEVTGYGTGAGLKGWNCRHDFYPVIVGVSVPTYTEEELKHIDPPPIEYDGKTYSYYDCIQRQRRIETAMRKTKRQIISAKGSGDEDMFTAKSILLRRQKEEYEKFSKAAGLLTQNERTQVYGFGHSEASKASWAATKQIKKEYDTFVQKIGVENSPTLDKFKKMWYANNAEYKELQNFASYREKVPNAAINDFRLYDNLKSKGLIKGHVVPIEPKTAYILEDKKAKDPAHIMKRMMERHITDDEIQSYINNAVLCEMQFKGTRLVYYSEKGVTVLTKTTDYDGIDWIVKTAWNDTDFSDDVLKLIEEAKKWQK